MGAFSIVFFLTIRICWWAFVLWLFFCAFFSFFFDGGLFSALVARPFFGFCFGPF
jgi:hypothetical protein